MNAPKSIKTSQKKVKGFNVFLLIFSVLVIATILTYIVPAGEYSRVEVDGRTMVESDSFKHIDSSPVSLFNIFSAIPRGMVEAGEIIFFVFIIGGTFGVLSSTGAIEALITTIARKLANKEKWLIFILMLFFAMGGSLMGMAEETLVYIPIIIPLALALGFDVITGTAIVLLGASIGFTTAIMNPFTVGIAQGIAGLPLFSGMGLRIILFIIMYIVSTIFVYRYAMKVKKDPSLGFYGKYNVDEQQQILQSTVRLTTTHKLVLFCFLSNFIALIIGVTQFKWFINEIAGLFIFLVIVIGFVSRMGVNKLIDSFMKGAADIIPGALVIGVARAILIVLNDGHIIDTILFYSAETLQHIPAAFNSIGMFVLQSFIHFIIPSGSAQASLTIPIMAPLADLVGITRQTAVLSFSLAEGIGNIIFPTSGYFMAALAIAGIPWNKWIKWILPLILIQYAISFIAITVAHFINYGPF
ncbi:AbgT family transporter [Lysinibacillus capsici]|uniref:YfcC family protein n=1 Tax=Lysinibacillus capsici TaxID=2115968 RepID=UPI002A834E1D|nr:AbgT family transporter [Lysinibacillus capsici]